MLRFVPTVLHFLLVLFFAPAVGVLPAKAAEVPVQVGFVYTSPAGDAGWSHAHEVARRELAKLPGISTFFIESIADTENSERPIREMARKGYDIIFTTSFGYMDPTIHVARSFPRTVFMHCSGYKTASNVGAYFGRMYQARFLTGLVAGAMAKTGSIGYVAAKPLPEVIRGINAFALGTRVTNPNAKVRVVWTDTWYDEEKERVAALGLFDSGVEVLAMHQDSPAIPIAAEERGVPVIGYHTDMSEYAPKSHLVAAVWNWLPFYKDVIAKVRAGTWTAEKHWPGLKDGIVGISPFSGSVPQNAREAVTWYTKEITSGRFAVFQGPVRDQKGKVRIQQGQHLDDDELLSMDWFVENVIGRPSL